MLSSDGCGLKISIVKINNISRQAKILFIIEAILILFAYVTQNQKLLIVNKIIITEYIGIISTLICVKIPLKKYYSIVGHGGQTTESSHRVWDSLKSGTRKAMVF